MKRMNNLKNVIAAKIMGGLVIGMAAVAGVSPDRKSTRLNSSHTLASRMPSSA